MSRKLIIDGNAVYEIDEECMIRRRLDNGKSEEKPEMYKEKKERNEDRKKG